jgi:starvation-inducible DNA-binding protein
MMREERTRSTREVQAIARELSSENHPDNPLVEQLARQVANAFVLFTNYKQYHWQAYGPLFRDLHKVFDEFGHEVLASLDNLAERMRMIGQDPPSRLSRIMELATVTSATAPDATMREMIEEADRNALIVIKEVRDAARLADERDDPGTVDLMSKLVQIHEKHEWWLRDILRRGDGLIALG